MDQITFPYGDHELTLHKSKELFAVKSDATSTDWSVREIVSRLAGAQPVGRLGRFHLAKVKPSAKIETSLNGARNFPFVGIGSHVFHTAIDEVPIVPTGEIYIVFKEGTHQQAQRRLLEDQQLEHVEQRGQYALVARATPRSANPLKVVRALQDHELIDRVEPDLASPAHFCAFKLPSDHRMKDEWHLENRGTHLGTSIKYKKGADARVIKAWQSAQSTGSRDIIVAVIDDGFDLNHPDLSGSTKIVAPVDFKDEDTIPTPDLALREWHGTACAGIAVGNADGKGIIGVAPGCSLMPIRMGMSLSDRQVETWFAWARNNGASVISCSWGGQSYYYPLSQRQHTAIQTCARQGRNGLGCVICFAAGNESIEIKDPNDITLNGFASHPDVIAVSASTSKDEWSGYSNYGANICVCAPSSGPGGADLITSDVTGMFKVGSKLREAGYSPGAITETFGHTSGACPIVAGVCALLLSINPNLTATQIRDIIRATARQIGDPGEYRNGHSPKFGYGCIDADAAMKALLATGDGSPGSTMTIAVPT